MLLSEAIAGFLAEDRAEATNDGYEKTLSKMAAILGPERDVSSITCEELKAYFARLRSRRVKYEDHPRRPAVSGPLSPATVENTLKTVKAFFNWLVRCGYLAASPANAIKLRHYRRPPGSSKAIAPGDLSEMVKYVRERKPRHRVRDLAILLFLSDTGCRVGGCASLTLDGLNLETGEAWIMEKGEKPQLVFFGDETAVALRDWLAVRPEVSHRYVWTTHGDHHPLLSSSISEIVRRIAKAAIKKSIGGHAIRHRVGQAWMDVGINAALTSAKLGHSDPGITLRNYANQDRARLRIASRKYALIALRECIAVTE